MSRILVRAFFLSLVIAVAVIPFQAPCQAIMGEVEEAGMLLPDGYVSKLIYHPALAGLGRIVRNEDGDILVQHLNAAGGTTVSLLDVPGDQLRTVLDFPPWVSTSRMVGGPDDTFFIAVEGEVRQVSCDGSYSVWGQSAPADMLYYSPEGKMLGIGFDGTSVVEIFPDGTATDIVTGLSVPYDVVATGNGTIFVSDIGAGSLIRKDEGEAAETLASITPDNTDLGLDAEGNLYLNNVQSRFALVDQDTGAISTMTFESGGCGSILSPSDFVFDDSGRVIFATWTDSIITWVDFSSGQGGQLLRQPWATTKAADVGPDDALYLGVNGCGSIPSKVVRFAADGSSDVCIDGLSGRIADIEFDCSGGLYLILTTATSSAVYYCDPSLQTLTMIPDSGGHDLTSLAVDPVTGHLFASMFPSPALNEVNILEFSSEGFLNQYTVSLPKVAMELLLESAPDGTLYAFGTEQERFVSGPEVDRWILRLDLAGGTSQIVFQKNRIGACPMGNFSVDGEGFIWWVLNPDFLLYRISPAGTPKLFGSSLPVDSASAHRNSEGDIFLNAPDGLFRIWMPTPSERIYLVVEDVEELSHYGVLGEGQATALTSLLGRAAENLDDQRIAAARSQLRAFLRQLDAYERADVLTTQQTDGLRMYVLYVIDHT